MRASLLSYRLLLPSGYPPFTLTSQRCGAGTRAILTAVAVPIHSIPAKLVHRHHLAALLLEREGHFEIHWVLAGGTNLDPDKDMHLHEGTITFVDDDHIEFCGVCRAGGKPLKDHECNMKLVRKK